MPVVSSSRRLRQEMPSPFHKNGLPLSMRKPSTHLFHKSMPAPPLLSELPGAEDSSYRYERTTLPIWIDSTGRALQP